MITNDTVDKIKSVRRGLTDFYNKLSASASTDEVIKELMEERGYTDEAMFKTLKEIGVFKLDYLSDIKLLVPDVKDADLKLWGIISEDGNYILGGRYVLPIRDFSGQVTALVGWRKDNPTKKYMTTPTFGFNRDVQFFNADCYKLAWEKFDGVVYVVEGIFDTVALKSLGLPVMGNMGLEMSEIKTQILLRFSKVIAIHDNDNAGKSVNPYMYRISGKSKNIVWNIKNPRVFLLLPKGVKDSDDLVKGYDCYDDLIKCQSARFITKIDEEV